MWKTGEIEPVIAEMHILLCAGELLQVLETAGSAGHGPAGALQLGCEVTVA